MTFVNQYELRCFRLCQPAADSLHHANSTEIKVNATGRKGIGDLLAKLLAMHNEQYTVAAGRGAGGDVALDNGLA